MDLKELVKDLYKDHHEAWETMANISKSVCEDNCKSCAKEIVSIWEKELKHHFEEEEKDFFPIIKSNKNSQIIDRLLVQHEWFLEKIEEMEDEPTPQLVKDFCDKLIEHIKLEEHLMGKIMKDPYKTDATKENNSTKSYHPSKYLTKEQWEKWNDYVKTGKIDGKKENNPFAVAWYIGTSIAKINAYEMEQRKKQFADGGEIKGGYMVFNYTDDIYASPEVFRTQKEAREFIKSFRKRFEAQGYYKTNQLEKINPEHIDLEVIPEDFNPLKMESGGRLGKPVDMIDESHRQGLNVVSSYDNTKGVILGGSKSNSYNESDYTKSYRVKTKDGEKDIMARYLYATDYADGGELRKMDLHDAVIYKDKTHYITQKDGVVGLVNMSQGAWGSDFPFTPLSRISVENEIRDMMGRKVFIPYTYADGGHIGIDNIQHEEMFRCFTALENELKESEFAIEDKIVDNTRSLVSYFRKEPFSDVEKIKLERFLSKYTDERVKPDFCKIFSHFEIKGNKIYGYTKSDIFSKGGQLLTYDELANNEFGMDYHQLGENEKEWVRDEQENILQNGGSLNKSLVSGTKAGVVYNLPDRKYILTHPIHNVQIGNYIMKLPKGTIIYNLVGGVLANNDELEAKFKGSDFGKSGITWNDKFGVSIRQNKQTLSDILANSEVLESYAYGGKVGNDIILPEYKKHIEKYISNMKVHFKDEPNMIEMFDDDLKDHLFVINEMENGNWKSAYKHWYNMDTASRENITNDALDLLNSKNKTTYFKKGGEISDYEKERQRQIEQGIIDGESEGISVLGMMQGKDNPVANKKANKYDLGYGHKGNGLTVYNRAKEVNGDYQNVAHISDDGTIKYYKNFENTLPNELKLEIELMAHKNYGKKDEIIEADDIVEELVWFTPEALKVVPKHQLPIISGAREEFQDAIKRINQAVKDLPKTYETEDTALDDKVVYLHYFYGSADWYIVEQDMYAAKEGHYQDFGWADLGMGFGEWGYISIYEIVNMGNVELDLYFEPKTFGEIMGKQKAQEEEAHEARMKRLEEDSYNFGANYDKEGKKEYELIGELLKLGIDSYEAKGNSVNFKYKGYDFHVFDNGGEFKMDNTTTEDYIGVFYFTEWDRKKTVKELAREIMETAEESVQENTKEPITIPADITNLINYLNEVKVPKQRAIKWNGSDYDESIASRNRVLNGTTLWNIAIKGGLDVARSGEEEIVTWDGGDLMKAIESFLGTDKITYESADGKIRTEVTAYKNPYEVNKAIEKLVDDKGDNHEDYSADELTFISNYSGYGGLEKFGAEGKGLLYEYYTPTDICKTMWGLAYKYGYGTIGDGAVLEPSVGTGNFLKYAPKDAHVDAFEINPYSAQICKILHPKALVHLASFEEMFIESNASIKDRVTDLPKYSLVIGNPPYGNVGGKFMGMGEKKHTKAQNYTEYFITRGLDLLVSGGLLVYIVGAEQKNGGKLFLDGGISTVKERIFNKADLIDAYRLPVGIFERTGVSSEIVVFKKR